METALALRIDLKDKLTQWFVFCVLISGLGLYGHYVYIYQPKQERIDQLKQEEDKLNRDLTVVKTQVTRLSQIRLELKNAEAEFAQLKEMFPD